MFIFYSIHYPQPDKVDTVVESMHRFGGLMATQPGLLFIALWPFYDPEEQIIMGVTVWESEDVFNAAMSAIAGKRGPGPSPEWERQPTEAFRLHSARQPEPPVNPSSNRADTSRILIFYSTHYPKPEHENDLLENMHAFGELMATQPGLIFHAPWAFKDPENGTLMGVTIWESREAFDAAMAAVMGMPRQRPLPEWVHKPADSYIVNAAR